MRCWSPPEGSEAWPNRLPPAIPACPPHSALPAKQDAFFKQLRTAPDGFSLVAEYFGKGGPSRRPCCNAVLLAPKKQQQCGVVETVRRPTEQPLFYPLLQAC